MQFHPDEEQVLREGGIIIGVDEVGRGSLAGPICAAACVITSAERAMFSQRNTRTVKIGDSKKLSKLQREKTYSWLKGTVKIVFIRIEAQQIDLHGIQKANTHAIEEALRQAISSHPNANAVAFIDHFKITLPKGFSRSISSTRGDSTYVSVACASIWAKVSRDAVMKDLAAAHPEYGWDSNVGYGTKAHIQGIQTYGATSYHRKSFLTKMQSSCSKEA